MDVQTLLRENAAFCEGRRCRMGASEPSADDVRSFSDACAREEKGGEEGRMFLNAEPYTGKSLASSASSSRMESLFSGRMANSASALKDTGHAMERVSLADGRMGVQEGRIMQEAGMAASDAKIPADAEASELSADDVRSFSDDCARDEMEGREEGRMVREAGQVMPSPSSLMESLFFDRMANSASANSASVLQDTGHAMERLVQRILVAEPQQGAQEVRITLGDGMLKGAEFTLSRDADGQLFVRIQCADEASFQTAVGARRNLMEMLEAHGEQVQVLVDRDDAGGGNEGDSRQRSRSLAAWDEEPRIE